MNRLSVPTPAHWRRTIVRRRLLTIMPAVLAAPMPRSVAATGVPYPSVKPGYRLQFPRDHGAHPRYRTEWWYLTAWVDTNNGPAGLQVTFFRSNTGLGHGNTSRFAPTQLLFGHAAFSDPAARRIEHAQIARRADGPHARFSTSDTNVVIGPPHQRWSIERTANDTYRIAVATENLNLRLEAKSDAPPWLQGQHGFSQKGPLRSQASHYYSRPRLALHGSVRVKDRQTTLSRGLAWLDHEWSSTLLADEARGWDWTGLHMDDGRSLMAFQIRGDKHETLWRSGAELSADGRSRMINVTFEAMRTWRSPASGVIYPVQMRLRATDGRQWRLEPLIDDQEIDTRLSTGILYWEGAMRVHDERDSDKEIGRGYLELTGYGDAIRL